MSEVGPADEGWRSSLRRLAVHVSPSRKRQFTIVLVLMLVGALAELVTLGAILPVLALLADPGKAASYPVLQNFFAALGWTRPDQILVPVTVLFAVIALTAAAIRLLLAWTSQRFVFQVGHELAVEVYRRTLYQPYLYHVSNNTSEIIASMTKVDVVVTGVLLQLMQAAIAGIIASFIVAALVAIDPVVAMSAAVGFGVIYFGVTAVMRRRVRANSRIWTAAHAERVKALQEGLGGIRDVLIEQAQPSFIRRFVGIDAKLRRSQAANTFIGSSPRYVIEAAGMVLITVMALILSQRNGGLSAALPLLGALALGAQRLLPLLQVMYSGWTTAMGNRQALSDVLAILDLPVAARFEPASPVTPVPFQNDIVFDRVGFRYGADRPPVLNDIRLRIEKGARVGFIGKTGSGKSTILDLLMGLLPPTQGRIRIDGRELTPDTVRGWQAQIAHVPQAIYLADTSLSANIAFGVPEAEIDLARVEAAARQAELADFVASLPAGYATTVGERGIRLSGGQRQRIGIARALYKEASVLVFDEATSALDSDTETAVMRAVGNLRRDLTIFVIAHRLSTLAFCDKVVRLEAGEIVGEGNYEQMVRTGDLRLVADADGEPRKKAL